MNLYQNLTQSEKTKVHRRAMLLSQRGYSPRDIASHLRDESFSVSYRTVEAWVYYGTRAKA